jgi:hypothetical protein
MRVSDSVMRYPEHASWGAGHEADDPRMVSFIGDGTYVLDVNV